MIKYFFNKICGLLGIKVGNARAIDKLIKNGNLRVGKNTETPNLAIQIQNPQKGQLYIEIGDDAMVSGNITIYGPNGRVKIGNRTFIANGSILFCYDEITLEDDIMVSWGCTIIDNNSHSLKWEERKSDVLDWKKGPMFKNWDVVKKDKILISSKCWIGFNSIITKGVTLGEGTIVASGSVVTKNSEPFTIIGGNPAKFIKSTI